MNLRRRLWYVCCLLGSGVAILFLYTLLHEGGHALVGILYGGKVDRMVLGLNAHVSISGAEYSRTGLALLNVAGLLLPVLFLVVALAVYQAKIKSALYHFFYGVLWMAISGSLLAWVIIPIIALFGTPPQGDDVTKFMTNTGLNPMIMILAAILIVAGLIILALKKGLFTTIAGILRPLLRAEPQKKEKVPLPRIAFRMILGIALLLVVILAGFRILTSQPVLETRFSMTVTQQTGDLKLPFEVKRSKHYDMSLSLDASGMLTDIQIYNEEGQLIYQNLAEYFTFDGNGNLELEQGQYEMVLTFLMNPQDMEEHFRMMGYDFDEEAIATLAGVFDADLDAGSDSLAFGQATDQTSSQASSKALGHKIIFSATIK